MLFYLLYFKRKTIQFGFIFFLISITACSPKLLHSKKTTKDKANTVRIANEDLEYEIIITDIGFNRFLNAEAQPKGYYSINFLERKNLFYVTSYNIRANDPIRYGNFYEWEINYDKDIHYGYEVNYLLYNYFLFFQKKYNQNL